MKRLRLFFLIAALAVLPCANSFAQFKTDSVVFRLDSFHYDNCWFNGNPPNHATHEKNFHFIVTGLKVIGDSTIYFGYGNGEYGLDTCSATLAIRIDSATQNILSFVYQESYVGQGNTKNGIKIILYHWMVNKVGKGYKIVTSRVSPPSSLKIDSWQYEYPHIMTDYESICTDTINFSDSSFSINFLQSPVSYVSTEAAPSSLRIFPNPSSNLLTIKNLHSHALEIFDLLSRNVLTRSVPEGQDEIEIDISALSEGCYWVRNGSAMHKFIIAR